MHSVSSACDRTFALSGVLLFCAGAVLPVAAQAQALDAANTHRGDMSNLLTTDYLNTLAPSEAEMSAAEMQEIQAIVSQIIAAETQHWSVSEKRALAEMEALGLQETELEALILMDAADMQRQLKSNSKLSKVSATGISSEQALKLAPMLLLSRYLLNIGRAAIWGGVVSAIRSADFDYGAMAAALRTGDTGEFMALLRSGITDQASFVDMVGSAATFACGSATLDVTPRLCDRFTNGLQKIFNRVQRSGRRSNNSSDNNPSGNRFNSRNRRVDPTAHSKSTHWIGQ